MSNDLTSSWEYPFAKKIEALEKRIAELEAVIKMLQDVIDLDTERIAELSQALKEMRFLVESLGVIMDFTKIDKLMSEEGAYG